jgi:hypothetical protein
MKFPGKKMQKDTSNIVLWMTLISVLPETQSTNSACMRRNFCKPVTNNQEANTFYGSNESRFSVEEMLDQEKNLVEQVLLPGG